MYVSKRVERMSGNSHFLSSGTMSQPARTLADVATRSVPAALLSDTIWLTGLEFLRHSEEPNATEEAYDLVDPDTDVEVRCNTTTATESHSGLGSHQFERFSTWQSLLRAMAFLIHVVQSFGSKNSGNQERSGWHHCSKPHTADALSQAKAIIIGCVQEEAYQAEVSCLKKGEVIPKNSPLIKLNPILDDKMTR